MAEAVVSLVIQKLSDLLIEERKFQQGARDGVKTLQDELKRMKCFLEDVDRRQDQDKRIQNWISEIRDLAYDIEDVIDAFLLKVAAPHTGGVHGIIKKITSMFTKAHHLHDIGTQIESIQVKIGDITRSMQTYGINTQAEGSTSSAGEMHRRLRRSHPHDKEEHIISFDAAAEDLRAQLLKKEERVRVVSIVGMGGLGKTTLAKKVYNDRKVKRKFDCYSWVFISQQFSLKDVIFKIAKNVLASNDISKLERMKEEELIEELHMVLKEKRYLVIIDDIWTIEAWNCLNPAFPNGKKGSKVLFTTRNKEVALFADRRSSLVEPPLLTNDNGWKLLCRKAFEEDGCAPEFEKLGREMVERCGGLPLAIVLLGGLLATKKSLREWQVVHGNINAQLIKLQQHKQYGGVYGILALSYHDLPFHLKPCFLYLSQFPEDWEFHKRSLIRMWIAEGFVSQPSEEEANQTMEDVGEEYLEELVNRCMVQVGEKDHTGIGVKTCRIHDLLRDMCISNAKEENFLEVIAAENENFNVQQSTTRKSRRIAIHPPLSVNNGGELFHIPSLKGINPHLRSLICLVKSDNYQMLKQQQIYIVKNFRLLRVLQISNISVGHLTGEIGSLIHLRYLGLRNVRIQSRVKCICFKTIYLPASLGNLKNLYTLDLRYNGHEFKILPDVLCKLESLRHLLGKFDFGVRHFHRLRHLETLKWIRADYLIQKDATFQLTNLRKLGIEFKEDEEIDVFANSRIFELHRLRSLDISSIIPRFFPVEPFSNLPYLTKLKVSGVLRGNLKFLPASLAKLTLSCSQIKKDRMKTLEKLPNLRFLCLKYGAYEGSKMVCSAHGFPKLEILELHHLDLKEWEIKQGAMPCLKTLSLESLLHLRMIPDGLKFITTLQELTFTRMTQEFERRVKIINGIEGEDFHKVRHIPTIMSIRPLRNSRIRRY